MKKLLPELTPKQKKIMDIVITCVEVIVVLIAIIASVIIISNPTPSSATVAKGPVKLLPVVSGSMDGDYKDSFKKGDLVIAGNPKNVLTLKEGDIITFKGNVNGTEQLITHRIIKVQKDEAGNALTYITHGDANPEGYDETVNPYSVLAVYKSHLKGVGKSIEWLQTPKNFLLVIILPLALLFIWNIIVFVRMIIQWKMEKAVANGGGAIDEEEIKRKAIEEYLASQNAANKEENGENKEEAAENKDGGEKEIGTDSIEEKP
ncbi:MAG: signal peptidase I, partial [Clostridia bacterium]|nr:signal peptidase I [Clostridia bacterium]